MAASFSLSNGRDSRTGAQKGFWAHAVSNLKSEQDDEKSSLTWDLNNKLYQSQIKSNCQPYEKQRDARKGAAAYQYFVVNISKYI